MARVVHFEIPSDDPPRAVAFYRDLFGWRIEDANGGTPYWLITTGEAAEPGINGAILPRQAPVSAVVNTVQVESIDATLRRLRELGGRVVTEPSEIPGVGRFAYWADPDGNLFGVLEQES